MTNSELMLPVARLTALRPQAGCVFHLGTGSLHEFCLSVEGLGVGTRNYERTASNSIEYLLDSRTSA